MQALRRLLRRDRSPPDRTALTELPPSSYSPDTGALEYGPLIEWLQRKVEVWFRDVQESKLRGNEFLQFDPNDLEVQQAYRDGYEQRQDLLQREAKAIESTLQTISLSGRVEQYKARRQYMEIVGIMDVLREGGYEVGDYAGWSMYTHGFY